MSGFNGGRLLSEKSPRLAIEERRRSPGESPSPTRLAIEDRHRLPADDTGRIQHKFAAQPAAGREKHDTEKHLLAGKLVKIPPQQQSERREEYLGVHHVTHQSCEEDEETEGYKGGLRSHIEENLSKSCDLLVPTASEGEESAEAKPVPCFYALDEDSVKVIDVVSVHITSYHNSTTSASPRLVTPSPRVSTTGRVGRSSGATVAEAAAARVAAAAADAAQSMAAEAAATPTSTLAPTSTPEACVKHVGTSLSRSCTKSARDVPPSAELTKRSVAGDAVCGSELASRMEARRKMQEESADTGYYLQENDLLFLVSDLESRYPSVCFAGGGRGQRL